ncbi:hypothetical protein [Flavobacterium sp. 25HG05S-40]|uniref:hypothetical protein n=1 Tax=Flavobacterium sp. 25HG05S-40 TaxID=3458682 RepID=UPI0040446352
MKNFNLFIFGSILTLLVSCDSTDTTNNVQTNNLEKIVTLTTYSDNPTYNTKNIKRYANFEVVSDSTFNNQDQFIYRTVITTNGLTKIIKTYLNTGEVSEHREENYDSQGRLIGRHTYEPISALFFTYVYNDDGTVTSKYYNDLDNQTTTFRTFTKNTDGLIYKNNYSYYDFNTGQTVNIEDIASSQGQILLSNNYSGTVTMYQYYPNPMPANLQKSENELNNLIVMGNELRYLAYNGNSYFKANDSDITTFNSANYKTYYKSVYTNTAVTPNTTMTTEKFYYYN